MDAKGASINEIEARITNFRMLTHCLNVLGRLQKDMKIITPKPNVRPRNLQIQDNSSFSMTGFFARVWRAFNKEQGREDNLEYVKDIIDELRKEFAFLFQHASRYIMQNNKECASHWKSTPLMTFTKDDTKDLDITEDSRWSVSRYVSTPFKKDEARTFAIQYRICKCQKCILSEEQMIVIRICELLVQALMAMAHASAGLKFLEETYNGDDSTITNIQRCQTDLSNIGSQYVKLGVYDDDGASLIKFDRPFISKNSDESALP